MVILDIMCTIILTQTCFKISLRSFKNQQTNKYLLSTDFLGIVLGSVEAIKRYILRNYTLKLIYSKIQSYKLKCLQLPGRYFKHARYLGIKQ